MTAEKTKNELQVLQDIIAALQNFDEETQKRLLKTAVTYLQLAPDAITGVSDGSVTGDRTSAHMDDAPFTDAGEELSPKEFMLEKDPITQTERVACLAYYLTRYRNTKHFKTLHVSKLNTEAAQPKFTNAAQAVKDSAKVGLLVQATRGHKQISGVGEQYVQTLPNHEEARRLLKRSQSRKRKPSKRPSGKAKTALKGTSDKKTKE